MLKSFIFTFVLFHSLVASSPTVPDLDYNRFCSIVVAYHEARSESNKGIEAVLDVVHNRASKQARSICSIVLAPKQFTDVKQAFNALLGYNKAKIDTVGLDKVILQVLLYKPNDTSIMWYHTSKVKPYWTKKFKKVKVVGSHIFYKE